MTDPIRCRTAADLTRHLAAIRKGRGIHQWQLAELVGKRQSQISVAESGRHVPSLDTALSLAAALGYDLALIPRPPYLVDVPLPDEDVTP